MSVKALGVSATVLGIGRADILRNCTSRRATTVSDVKLHRLNPAIRVYPARKAHLFDYYRHTLTQKPVILLYRHQGLSVKDFQRLRIDVEKLTKAAAAADESTPQIVVARTGILSALAKVPWPEDEIKSNALALSHLKDELIGPMLMILCPSLVPPLMKKILELFERTGRPKPTMAQVQAKLPKSQIPRRLVFVAGLVEGQVLYPRQMKQVADLPRLDTLHGQIISLIDSPANQLAQILDHARGSRLVNLLSQDRNEESK